MTIKVLQVKKTSLYDVFRGVGWSLWTRVDYDKAGGFIVYKDGLPMYHKIAEEVLEACKNYKHVSYNHLMKRGKKNA